MIDGEIGSHRIGALPWFGFVLYLTFHSPVVKANDK